MRIAEKGDKRNVYTNVKNSITGREGRNELWQNHRKNSY